MLKIVKFVTTEVTGFNPSSAIHFPLHNRHEILDPIPVPAVIRVSNLRKSVKLFQQQINFIIQRHNSGASLRQLAADFGVSYETIRQYIKKHNLEEAEAEVAANDA